MQTKNNYDKDVFNGDIVIMERVDAVEQEVSMLGSDAVGVERFGWLLRRE
ncbi:MAG: hypothetical protein ACLQLH_02390 [Terracidiphilus sp.]